ncbi:MAG: peptide-methionine (R)-S-oxide reductase [Candidatus Kerfeldbacteria bacterium RIFCSPHIGHO2_02_FULL_42_14]|uniref:peptide-methionine (R)-S-oxide reductase n=1 Tax=Candidatus Kerfeldbacteria bacterium RIFCSPHIGHO2_02_FULL_42_14 TaxID=1798540 RepID=A0A1G2ATK9_9BACT|nr:MAG: peptide-methionine (R)-S-oxide reductase [Candidatus Kerfeldbacteria bacterium RIFCSPHIGHO2_02_FULL_42_14]OGY82336.1 MAG: peptide-methionine (R)-S-oxide reductase [Candidatus Kerfeldbacteria bacterium RIFCSPHIGHO2_12_FULL_42_13]OGY84642.1 MAG: peptide-methionine (R)-S-oxide reductase [Candidatus Kerfeldbacteria bacterium RIFCSPLOWO2_02_FULL_42_19]OGY85859.1 MAG: peptide-methionine (R)-S-oxide reductase [Candidatus Kerfeldbacteria bacterium RIFCSPLOWO2_12_FULL_43_9]
MQKISQDNEHWREKLTPEQYRVLREKDTELPFIGKYYNMHENGMYVCAACGNPLFASEHKYDSGTGWPSYDRPFSEDAVEYREDESYSTKRTEVICRRCDGHLGHVFDDGPKETTCKRFCINSTALNFRKQKK